jgi:hypothetical protein
MVLFDVAIIGLICTTASLSTRSYSHSFTGFVLPELSGWPALPSRYLS